MAIGYLSFLDVIYQVKELLLAYFFTPWDIYTLKFSTYLT